MIHICRITDISQTTCILRSIPAHFLQLLRDGALRGRTCRRHGLTLNIFFFPSLLLRFFLSPSVPRGAQRWSEASQEIRPHSIVHLRLALASTQHFGVFSVPASVMQPISRSPRLSTLKTCQLWNEAFSSSLVFPLWSAWMLVARRSLVCSADQATSLMTQSAPRAHRPTVENTFVIFYVCKAKPKIK